MKKYWKDIDAKQDAGPAQIPDVPVGGKNALLSMFGEMKDDGSASRRDFLKLCGFSFAVTTLASCQSKVRKVVPYVVAPYEITPGEANYYASSYISGSDYCGIVVKTREGRPIKIEGNPESGITRGGTSARVQASLMELYDTSRFQAPQKEGVPVEARVAAILLPIWPDLPMPVTTTRPWQLRINSQAVIKLSSKCFACC